MERNFIPEDKFDPLKSKWKHNMHDEEVEKGKDSKKLLENRLPEGKSVSR